MTREEAIKAAQSLDKKYMAPVCPYIARSELGRTLEHLRWMVLQMRTQDFSEAKTMRWLGYIQGILVGVYGASLEEMKELSRSHSASAGVAQG